MRIASIARRCQGRRGPLGCANDIVRMNGVRQLVVNVLVIGDIWVLAVGSKILEEGVHHIVLVCLTSKVA